MAFGYIYGDFCCNELGCESVFHKQCASATEVPADILEKSNVHDHPIQLSDDILHGNMHAVLQNVQLDSFG
ncbi:hypothetical protein ARALYDRAFT_899912 [Arabidopsis lyrata subsp. lyrata]|uniref:DC1 domain-containing protein n=1 Tax=Arabidopsis lyrata subsp. lyrata TaxID=81972 RepID=D7L6X9_ARALL|nr:hypothetical protein ARALYDRAFT_899912 [Arabidopsis lyrata subsp. lyrata]